MKKNLMYFLLGLTFSSIVAIAATVPVSNVKPSPVGVKTINLQDQQTVDIVARLKVIYDNNQTLLNAVKN